MGAALKAAGAGTTLGAGAGAGEGPSGFFLVKRLSKSCAAGLLGGRPVRAAPSAMNEERRAL